MILSFATLNLAYCTLCIPNAAESDLISLTAVSQTVLFSVSTSNELGDTERLGRL